MSIYVDIIGASLREEITSDSAIVDFLDEIFSTTLDYSNFAVRDYGNFFIYDSLTLLLTISHIVTVTCFFNQGSNHNGDPNQSLLSGINLFSPTSATARTELRDRVVNVIQSVSKEGFPNAVLNLLIIIADGMLVNIYSFIFII